jgi:hypothetical protein
VVPEQILFHIGRRIYRCPVSAAFFQGPRRKLWIEVSTVYQKNDNTIFTTYEIITNVSGLIKEKKKKRQGGFLKNGIKLHRRKKSP